MSTQVFDQFMRRRANQVYFGGFVGLSLYTLVTLATVNDPFNPVFGAAVAFLATVAALYLLIVLLYTTINQMRPVEIIEAIHGHILRARERQMPFVRATRRVPALEAPLHIVVRAKEHGYVTRIDLEALRAEFAKCRDDVEVVLAVSIGSFVAFEDGLAEVKATTREAAEGLGDAVWRAIRLERQRDIAFDPAYGIEQLEMIAWTSISTAKSNPAPGLMTIRSLRDVMARWTSDESIGVDEAPLPVVYRDITFATLMDAFESLAVASSESMQHQNYIEIVRTFAAMFARLPSAEQTRAEDLILRILSALGDHVLTAELESALTGLVEELDRCSRHETARAVGLAKADLGRSVGRLNSRATRTQPKPSAADSP
jgi:uncharacterized membrane protein